MIPMESEKPRVPVLGFYFEGVHGGWHLLEQVLGHGGLVLLRAELLEEIIGKL